MANIRQKIKALTLSKEERAFIRNDITDDKGNLTDVGRRVVLDQLFTDSTLQKAVYDNIVSVEKEEKNCEKKSK